MKWIIGAAATALALGGTFLMFGFDQTGKTMVGSILLIAAFECAAVLLKKKE